jgi:hypothetical protein
VTIPSRIESKDFNFFHFGRTLAALSVSGECAKIFNNVFKVFASPTFMKYVSYRLREINYFDFGFLDLKISLCEFSLCAK